MLYKLAAYIHVAFARRARRIVAALEGERGQGTVEYVGLILLVSLLMVGMVAAMKGFNGKQGTELADVIVEQDQAGRERDHVPLSTPGASEPPPAPIAHAGARGERAAAPAPLRSPPRHRRRRGPCN